MGTGLVDLPRQTVWRFLHLYLVAWHPAAAADRPAHGVRVEVPAPAISGECDDRRWREAALAGSGAVFWRGIASVRRDQLGHGGCVVPRVGFGSWGPPPRKPGRPG